MAEGYFWGQDPNINQQLRQRIAMQMMQGAKKGYPKNLGEGLTAIGDALGDRGLAEMLMRGDAAQQQAAKDLATKFYGGGQSSDAEPTSRPAEPTATADRTEVEPGVVGPGYNSIDAQAGLPLARRTPGYLQGAIERATPDPTTQAYLGTLSAAEARGPADVSPTGAAGPFQFTRGTGRQYGLLGAGGDQRGNLDASAQAALQLTQDNAAVFQRVSGRAPTAAELAVMHQQGGVTGARMVAGTGNAPPANLAVNNINPAASPQAAVRQMNRFYGMPNVVPPVGRDAIAAAAMPRPGGPQPNPILPAAGRSAALPLSALSSPGSDLPPEILTGASAIRPAPPVTPEIRTPPVQMAQAQPVAQPGYVMPEPGAVTAPPIVPLSAAGQRALAILNANQNNEYVLKGPVAQVYANEVARQKLQQTQIDEAYKAQLLQNREMAMERQKQLADQAKRIADVARTQQETQAGRLIDPGDKGYVLGPDGVARPLKVEGGATVQPKLTEFEGKNLDYYQRGKRALADLGTGSELHNFLEWHASGMPVVGNYLASTKFQEQYNAAREFAAIVLRRESGAAVTPKETEDVINRYIAKPGTAPEVAVQKQFMREGVINSLRDTLGKGSLLADRFDQTFDAERARLAEAKAAAGGKPVAPADLPPVTINSKEEKDALSPGRRYRLPDDRPGEHRVKK